MRMYSCPDYMRIFLTNSFRSKDFMGVLTDCMLSLAISILGMFLEVGSKGFTLFGMVIFLSLNARIVNFTQIQRNV